ncbi:DUF6487 domain-containing protein, partial [Dysosmobacter welbionis]
EGGVLFQKKHGALRKIHGFSPPCSFVFFIITNILGKSSISGEFIKEISSRFFLCRDVFLWEATDPLLRRPLLLSFPAFCRNPAGFVVIFSKNPVFF